MKYVNGNNVLKHTHKMILYNIDLVITWIYENDLIKITEVKFLFTDRINLIRFLSKNVFENIINDIEKNLAN